VLDGDPAPLPRKGAEPPPNFRPMSVVAKRGTDRMYDFRDNAFCKFWQFGLKVPIDAPFLVGLGGTFLPNDVTHFPNSERTILGLKHVI